MTCEKNSIIQIHVHRTELNLVKQKRERVGVGICLKGEREGFGLNNTLTT